MTTYSTVTVNSGYAGIMSSQIITGKCSCHRPNGLAPDEKLSCTVIPCTGQGYTGISMEVNGPPVLFSETTRPAQAASIQTSYRQSASGDDTSPNNHLQAYEGSTIESSIYHIGRCIGNDWRKLARQLRFTAEDIDSYNLEFGFQGIERICCELLFEWKRRQKNFATKDALIRALTQIERRDISCRLV